MKGRRASISGTREGAFGSVMPGRLGDLEERVSRKDRPLALKRRVPEAGDPAEV